MKKTHRLSSDYKTMCGKDAGKVMYIAMASWEGVDCKSCIKQKGKKETFEWD